MPSILKNEMLANGITWGFNTEVQKRDDSSF